MTTWGADVNGAAAARLLEQERELERLRAEVAAWRAAVDHHGPTCLILTRQGVPVCTDGSAVATGAATVREATGAELVLLGTGFGSARASG